MDGRGGRVARSWLALGVVLASPKARAFVWQAKAERAEVWEKMVMSFSLLLRVSRFARMYETRYNRRQA